jgi:DNA-binding NarL/FixJ family response regulator
VIVSALRLVAAGNRYIPDQMFENSAERRRGLSDRQLEVLRLMLKGLSNREIGNELNIAQSTVKQHVSVIYEVLHVKTRAEAIVVATRQGYKTEE